MKDISWPHQPLYYDIGACGTAYLLNKVGKPNALLDVFHPYLEELGWEGAFVKTFGISSGAFYEEFDAFLLLPYEE